MRAWRWLVAAPLAGAVVGVAASFAIPPTYTARAVLIPPQQQQNTAALALQNLSALAGVAAGTAGVRNLTDQYVALLQTANVTDRLIDGFKLQTAYGVDLRSEARRDLDRHTRVSAGRRDGLVTIEVDDRDPRRAADLANAYVDQLRRLAGELSLTEAQQRRAFFEQQLKQTRKAFDQARLALQASGFDEGAIRAEPKALAEGYGKLRAEVTGAEVRLQMLRRQLTDNAPEVQRALAQLATLRREVARLEATETGSPAGDYVNRYRDFKYQEALLEVLLRQYELARLDEAREGPMVQVIDAATPPDKKSKPSRALAAVLGAFAAAVLALAGVGLTRRRGVPGASAVHPS